MPEADVTTFETANQDGGFRRRAFALPVEKTEPGEVYFGHAQDVNLNPVNEITMPDGRRIGVRDWNADARIGEPVLITLTGLLYAPGEKQ